VQPEAHGPLGYDGDLRLGVEWILPFTRRVVRVSGGYDFDYWLFFGGVDTIPAGQGRLFPTWRFRYTTLTNRGPFFHMEIKW
jgi:hypothetical protein